MAQLLILSGDRESSLPDAFMHKSPRGGKDQMCFSPASQISTAPSTPSHTLLPDADVPELQFTRTTTSSSIPEESEEEEFAACFGMPPLQSELGQRIEKFVNEEMKMRLEQTAQEEELPVCFGMPPLQSELGQRIEKVVNAMAWLQKETEAGQERYLIDNEYLRWYTWGLAYRRSKNVEDHDCETEGVSWGTEILASDAGDGWLKVGQCYLPTMLEGICVAQPIAGEVQTDAANQEVEAMWDGPALTENGVAVDLDGGSPIYFSTLSSSHSCKEVTIKAIRDKKNAQTAQYADLAAKEVAAEALCSIDDNGILHGHMSYAWKSASNTKQASEDAKGVIKNFHQKRQRRMVQMKASIPGPVLCIDPTGKAVVHLYLPQGKTDKTMRRASKPEQNEGILIIDSKGTVHPEM